MDPLIPRPQIESWVKYQKPINWLFYILAGLGGALLLNHYLPDITNFVDNLVTLTEQLLTLAVMSILLLAVVYTAKKCARAAIMMLDNFALRMEMAAIKADPFGTAQNAINKNKAKLKTMHQHIFNLNGAIMRLDAKLKEFGGKRAQNLNKAKSADEELRKHQPGTPQHTKYKTILASQVRMAEKVRAAIERLGPNRERASKLYNFLLEFMAFSEAKIAEAEQALELAQDEFNINKDSQAAIQAATSALDGEQKKLFDQAMFEIQNQIYTMVGEIDHVMQMTQPILEMQRFDDQVALQGALDNFQQWLDQDTALPAAEKRQMLVTAGSHETVPVSFSNTEERVLVPRQRSKYDAG